jgi:NADP-dependent 3-hydroxy acid dehydrogenase YdfG
MMHITRKLVVSALLVSQLRCCSCLVPAIIVTGGSSGLGKECARKLAASSGAHIILACRDQRAGATAAAEILAEHPGASVVTEVSYCTECF